MAYLELRDVTFAYPNGHTAIEHVSLAIDAGERVAIIGQNGAGKTSAAKLMNGLLRPSVGDVVVDGWNTREHTTAQVSRKVGYVFQNPDDQIFHNDVRGEIEFGPRNLGVDDDELTTRVERSAELAGITQFLDENPYDLPFSTRKFVTIASVIAMDTQMVILDEPTAGQDREGMAVLGAMIDELTGRGVAVVTITHDMEFVVRNFHRVVVMADRRIQADADRREVFWNLPVLERSMLKQPYVSDLANALDLPGRVLDVPELLGALGVWK